MKEKNRKEYLQRVRAILKTDINAKNTTDAIKTYAMPILRYGFGVLNWTMNELRSIDTKIGKLLTKHGFHHPKSNTHRLYLSRKHGGRGLIGAMDCHQQECEALAGYLKEARGRDPLVRIVEQTESRKINGIMKYYVGTKNKSAHDIDKPHKENLHAMKLHGEYFNQQKNIPNVHIELSNEWLEKTYLR